MGKNFLGSIIKYRFSVVHNNKPFHIFRNVFHAVGHQNNGDSSHFMKFRDLIQDIIPALRVKTCCRLIQDQDLRIHGKHACNGHSFLLASGKFKRRFFEIGFFYSNMCQCLLRFLLRFLSGKSLIHRSKTHIGNHIILKKLMLRILEHQANFAA